MIFFFFFLPSMVKANKQKVAIFIIFKNAPIHITTVMIQSKAIVLDVIIHT